MGNKIKYTSKGIEVNGEFVPLTEVMSKVNLEKIREEDLSLLTIEWKESRGFNGICEQIVLSRSNIDKVIEAVTGKYIEFGEIAGKHSDVGGDIEKCDISIKGHREVESFLLINPSGHEYDHSFLRRFVEYNEDENDEFDWLRELLN